MDQSLHVLHVISGLWKHTGGPAESLPGLCTALVKEGCKVTLAALEGPMADSVWKCQASGVNVHLFRPNFRHTIWYSAEMAKKLPVLAREANIVHVHGLWEHPMWLGGQVARRLRIPLVMSLRGSLNPTALMRSRWKKKLVANLFDIKNLQAASCLHATADPECQGFRHFGLTNPVAVIPNAVNLSCSRESSNVDEFFKRFPECRGKRLMLFMSRINPTKGLLDLAEAWSEVAPYHPDWHLLIAGPDERGHLAKVLQAFKNYKAESQVTYAGPLYGRERNAALNAAELFILPTHTENFGIAIAEALSAGVPVITTHGAPWSGLIESGSGWWIPVKKDSLVKTLNEALALPTETLKAMGFRGKNWVNKTFSWDSIANEMLSVYTWLKHKNTMPPQCIRL